MILELLRHELYGPFQFPDLRGLRTVVCPLEANFAEDLRS
jgi:hypothetical protein